MGTGDSKSVDAFDTHGEYGASSTPTDTQPPDPAMQVRRLQAMLDEEGCAREAFATLWELHVPGGVQRATAPRPLVHEVLLQAAQQLELSASRSAQARQLATEVLGGSFRPIAFEDALRLFRSFCSMLLSLQLGVAEEPAQDLSKWRPRAATAQTASRELAELHLGGARKVDGRMPALSSKQPTANGAWGQAVSIEALDRPTRAKLESVHAGLRAAVCNAQSTYDGLLSTVLGLRGALASGGVHGDVQSQNHSQSAPDEPNQLVQHLSVPELQMDHDRKRGRSDALKEKVKRQQSLLGSLRQECHAQEERAIWARRQRDEMSESLSNVNQEHGDLVRKAKTEQLRAAMLREAFEKEQSRVGLSLERAETLEACKIEVEEQAMSRECASAVAEMEAARAPEDEFMEAQVQRLTRELQYAQRAAQSAAQSADQGAIAAQERANTLDVTLVETQRHAAVVELEEARRRCRGATATARKRAADAAAQRAAVEVLERRAEDIRAQLERASPSRSQAELESQLGNRAELESLQKLQAVHNALPAKDNELLLRLNPAHNSAAARQRAQLLAKLGGELR